MSFSRLARQHQRWLIAALSVIGVFAVATLAAAEWLARSLPELAAKRTGRRIEVRGPLEVNLWSLRPSVVAHGALIGNPPWMPSGVLAEVSKLTVVVDFPLPGRSLTIRNLELAGARLHLVRDAQGRANWQTQDPSKARRANSLMIHGLDVTAAALVLDDARRHLRFTGSVTAGEVADGGAPVLKITGVGKLNGLDTAVEIVGDSLATARRGKPYRFRLDERANGARLTASGVLPQPFDIGLMDAAFTSSGSSLRDIYRMTGFALPESDRFSLAGKLSRRRDRATFSDLQGRIGESDVDGVVTLATVNGVRRFEIDLHSAVFRLRDMGKHGEQQPANKPLFPDSPIPLGIVKNREGSVRYRADRIVAGPLSLTQLVGRATIHAGMLEVPSVEWHLAEGRFTGTMEVDARREVPSASLDLSVSGLEMSRLARKSWKQPPMAGRMHARLHLDADGNSLRQFASSVDGTITAVLPHGAMRASLAELTGVNLRGIGLSLQNDSSETEVRCAVASFEGTDGRFKAQQFLIDTNDVLIEGGGTIDLRSESLDLTLRGQPKTMRFGRVRSPLQVRGPLRSPSFSLDKGRLLAQTGEAVLLGVALTPVAAALALIDPGLARDANCAELARPAQGR